MMASRSAIGTRCLGALLALGARFAARDVANIAWTAPAARRHPSQACIAAGLPHSHPSFRRPSHWDYRGHVGMSQGPAVETSGTFAWIDGKSHFWMGGDALQVPMSMHASNRERLVENLRARAEVPEGAVILLQGGNAQSVYDTDTEWDFKQESNFQYLFGVKEPGCWGAIRVSDGKSVLFVPLHPESHAAWLGPIKPAEWFERAYEVDAAFTMESADTIGRILREDLQAKLLMSPSGENRDSGSPAPMPPLADVGVADMELDAAASKALYEALAETRAIKSKDEIKVLQFASDASSEAHIAVMQKTPSWSRRGVAREHLAASAFRYETALRGCMGLGYTPICPTGERNSFLHYGHPAEPNAEAMETESLTLRDMGAVYHGYTADITCTYPVSGKFSPEQRLVYEAVLTAMLAVEESIQPGVSYKDMHRLAQRTLLSAMKDAGLFEGEVDDMMEANLMNYFMCHGLGHALGLDVHDVGGYELGTRRQDDPSVKENLRFGRPLSEGNVITVEPGFYFNSYLIEKALNDPNAAKFINKTRLQELRSVGGVRIEDNVVITATGCRVLTNVPRSPEDVEEVMAGRAWPVDAGRGGREFRDGQLVSE
mmetsp:Transcript_43149/g.101377  ORF Transcript_43149/g.101377 Transcript_43149/m.101377 type:complete len:602 (-) Transcript_43149:7-1812(-)